MTPSFLAPSIKCWVRSGPERLAISAMVSAEAAFATTRQTTIATKRSIVSTRLLGPPRREAANLRRVHVVHARKQRVFGERVGEQLAHSRMLVGVIDLGAAEAPADPGDRHALRIARRPVLEGEIARRRRAGIEMLMEPHVRRYHQGADLPL